MLPMYVSIYVQRERNRERECDRERMNVCVRASVHARYVLVLELTKQFRFPRLDSKVMQVMTSLALTYKLMQQGLTPLTSL